MYIESNDRTFYNRNFEMEKIGMYLIKVEQVVLKSGSKLSMHGIVDSECSFRALEFPLYFTKHKRRSKRKKRRHESQNKHIVRFKRNSHRFLLSIYYQ